MKKSLVYITSLSLCIALNLSGCGSQTIPTSDKQSSNVENPPAQQAVAVPVPVYERIEIISSPDEAKQLLIDGNERFTSGKPLSKDLSSTRRGDLMKNGQHPFAVIVSCSDSRVPPELLFDQALGDLFVVRVAGNVITPVELGSIEYAVEHLKTPLVVVLGHEECGAVTAAVQGGTTHGSIGAIIEKIKPSVDSAKAMGLTGRDLIEMSTDLNMQNALKDISKSPIIKEGVEVRQVKMIGIKYDLDEGILQFSNE
ncbi:carbonic anhydrase [Desulfosporosinus fructosivorans]|uniref:Carbonic anhydrase n=1 Tax=Desulfosporosinus fructosivorans TaxID=2018669 RepID=A0A4Z0R047_9FIRM|nr:carbonic anhydrase [Desulfosporosinus fructosivorans]TGE36128.1 carbonic anhydrase [Desulfosporosinus fructosivorans]